MEPLLTARQWQVLARLAQGMSGKHIGRELGISHETVRKHIAVLRDRLGLHKATELANYYLSRTQPNAEQAQWGKLETLTPREKEVAHLLIKGLSAKEVACRLAISPATAAKHRENLLGKLGMNKTGQLLGAS